MEINKTLLFPYMIYNKPFRYNEYITLYPVTMKEILKFQQYQIALTLRKDSIFCDKNIIKMEYWDFIKYSCRNIDLSQKYDMPYLMFYYDFIINIFGLVCGEESEIKYNTSNLNVYINDFEITNEVFNDLRKIIIIQNDIDFNVDEFLNIDTVKALEKAKEFEMKKNKENADIEDYIDSLVVSLKVTEEYVENMTIRKFWRYINRINKHEQYEACLSGQMGGFVTFKEPLQHWMTTIEVSDKYDKFKTDEDELRNKIEG